MKQTSKSVPARQFFKAKINQSIFGEKNEGEEMEEKFGMSKKNYGTEADTET